MSQILMRRSLVSRLGFSTILLLSTIGMVTADRRARHRQHKAMLEAEVPKMMEELKMRSQAACFVCMSAARSFSIA